MELFLMGQVVRTVGKSHNLSAALLTGGKKEFREEQRRIGRMNIVVATPVSEPRTRPAPRLPA